MQPAAGFGSAGEIGHRGMRRHLVLTQQQCLNKGFLGWVPGGKPTYFKNYIASASAMLENKTLALRVINRA